MIALALWFGFSVAVGVTASAAGRSGVGWFMMGLMFSPVFSAVRLYMLSEQDRRELAERL